MPNFFADFISFLSINCACIITGLIFETSLISSKAFIYSSAAASPLQCANI